MDAVSYAHSAKQAKRIKKFIANPDSNSGLITVPKVIGSGENITVPEGRVAVLPNIQVDGTLNVEGEVFIPAGATFGDLESQIALKADTTYVDAQLSNKANTADLKEIGVEQTWQDVTASRLANGTTYYNTTGKPIFIIVSFVASGVAYSITLNINGAIIASGAQPSTQRNFICAIIPPNQSYSIVPTYGTVSGLIWQELR